MGCQTEKPEGAGYRYGAIRIKREWGLNLEKEEHGVVECLNIILIKVRLNGNHDGTHFWKVTVSRQVL